MYIKKAKALIYMVYLFIAQVFECKPVYKENGVDIFAVLTLVCCKVNLENQRNIKRVAF